eukprot:77374-Prorocentrum_minimum.AAC.6
MEAAGLGAGSPQGAHAALPGGARRPLHLRRRPIVRPPRPPHRGGQIPRRHARASQVPHQPGRGTPLPHQTSCPVAFRVSAPPSPRTSRRASAPLPTTAPGSSHHQPSVTNVPGALIRQRIAMDPLWTPYYGPPLDPLWPPYLSAAPRSTCRSKQTNKHLTSRSTRPEWFLCGDVHTCLVEPKSVEPKSAVRCAWGVLSCCPPKC